MHFSMALPWMAYLLLLIAHHRPSCCQNCLEAPCSKQINLRLQ